MLASYQSLTYLLTYLLKIVQTREIAHLRSQLDVYRTVAAVTFPGAATAAKDAPPIPAAAPPQSTAGARKQRNHGISGEPQALTTVDDIMGATTKGRSKRSDSIKSLVAELASHRHAKSPQ